MSTDRIIRAIRDGETEDNWGVAFSLFDLPYAETFDLDLIVSPTDNFTKETYEAELGDDDSPPQVIFKFEDNRYKIVVERYVDGDVTSRSVSFEDFDIIKNIINTAIEKGVRIYDVMEIDVFDKILTDLYVKDFYKGLDLIRTVYKNKCARRIQRFWRKWWYDDLDSNGVSRFCKQSMREYYSHNDIIKRNKLYVLEKHWICNDAVQYIGSKDKVTVIGILRNLSTDELIKDIHRAFSDLEHVIEFVDEVATFKSEN